MLRRRARFSAAGTHFRSLVAGQVLACRVHREWRRGFMSIKPFVIVVGVDYSEHAERALRAAWGQAVKEQPAEIHVVHVSRAIGAEPLLPALAPYLGASAMHVPSLDEHRAQLDAYLDSVLPTLPQFGHASIRVVAHIALDAPVAGVTHLAFELESDMIVIGSHGRHGPAQWVLGSVAEGIVRQARCAVLVVPPTPVAPCVPSIEPPCLRCVTTRQASRRAEMWCEQHRDRGGRLRSYNHYDPTPHESTLPLVLPKAPSVSSPG